MIAERRVGITVTFYIFAVLLGLLIAYQDVASPFGDDNAKVTPFLLITASCFLSLFQPVHPWRWALAIGIWLPLVHLVRHLLGAPAPDFGKINASLSIFILAVISLTACLLGSFCGFWLRKALLPT
jgi:uncharacterized membrane protein